MTNANWLYYDRESMQVEYIYSAANLSINRNCETKGLLRAVVPDGIVATRDHKIEVSEYKPAIGEAPAIEVTVTRTVDSLNPVQPDYSEARAVGSAYQRKIKKLLALGLTQEEIDA